MKKLLLILTLIAMLLLSSCAPNLSSEKTQPQLSGQESTAGNAETSGTENGKQEAFGSGDPNWLYLDSLKKYNEYFSKLDVRPDMIYYEDISQMGEFYTYTGFFSPYYPTYKLYEYQLVDSSGYEFDLAVIHADNVGVSRSHEYVQLTAKAGDNLAVCSTQERAKLEHNGFTYTYVVGKLLSITWVENGIRFEITGNSTLADYPMGTDTFLGRLLDGGTYKTALKSIQDMKLTKGLPKGQFESTVTPVS